MAALAAKKAIEARALADTTALAATKSAAYAKAAVQRLLLSNTNTNTNTNTNSEECPSTRRGGPSHTQTQIAHSGVTDIARSERVNTSRALGKNIDRKVCDKFKDGPLKSYRHRKRSKIVKTSEASKNKSRVVKRKIS